MVVMPKVDINTDLSAGMCFGCGRNNPIGLKLEFQRNGNEISARFTTQEHHQGWPGVVHGGIVAAIIDEAMGYATHFAGLNCLTGKMEIKLKSPAPVGQPLVISSSVEKSSRRLIGTQARISLSDGTLVAEGKATHFIIERTTDGKGVPQP